jgi:hypothetical protein
VIRRSACANAFKRCELVAPRFEPDHLDRQTPARKLVDAGRIGRRTIAPQIHATQPEVALSLGQQREIKHLGCGIDASAHLRS